MLRPSHENMTRTMVAALRDLSILAGDDVGPSDVTWRDVAGTAAVNLRVLADLIEASRTVTLASGPVVFPSPVECLEALAL